MEPTPGADDDVVMDSDDGKNEHGGNVGGSSRPSSRASSDLGHIGDTGETMEGA